MSEADLELRYCPICEQSYAERVCPQDGVLTVPAATMQAVDRDLEPGVVIGGRYRVEARLGSGGMAKVYRATQLSMQRPVALKVMQAGLLSDAQAMKRFYREAQAASSLTHPNIVNVHDFGVDDETQMPFLAMELVEGKSLNQLLAREGPLDVARASAVLAQVTRALVEAHAKGVVHRDLKPDNVMIATLEDGHEHVTVLDFGIAKVARRTASMQDSLTASGIAIGTPRYMAPEQVLGREVDFRADLYALGCILHEMLTNAPPYEGEETVQVMMQHVHGPMPELPETCQGPVRALHAALLAKDARLRPATTGVVARIAGALASGGDVEVERWLAEAQVVVTEAPTPQITAAPPVVKAEESEIAATVPSPAERMPAAPTTGPHDPKPRAAPWPWIVGGGIIGLLIVILIGRPGVDDAPEVTPIAPPPAEAAAPAPEPEPEPPPSEAAPEAPRVVRVVSVPAGARVLADGELLGQTPLEVELTDAPREVELRLRGYRSAKRTLSPDASGPLEVRLRKRRKAPSEDFPPLAPR